MKMRLSRIEKVDVNDGFSAVGNMKNKIYMELQKAGGEIVSSNIIPISNGDRFIIIDIDYMAEVKSVSEEVEKQ